MSNQYTTNEYGLTYGKWYAAAHIGVRQGLTLRPGEEGRGGASPIRARSCGRPGETASALVTGRPAWLARPLASSP